MTVIDQASYLAQQQSSAALMESLMTRMRNLAGELEAQGWTCEIVEGSWVLSAPGCGKGEGDEPAAGA